MLLGRAHCNSLLSNVHLQAMFTLKNISAFYNSIKKCLLSGPASEGCRFTGTQGSSKRKPLFSVMSPCFGLLNLKNFTYVSRMECTISLTSGLLRRPL